MTDSAFAFASDLDAAGNRDPSAGDDDARTVVAGVIAGDAAGMRNPVASASATAAASCSPAASAAASAASFPASAPFEGDARLDQLHRVLLMMLKDFARMCEREGLTWIAMYGTAIGALRHQGFIPWDDDLDICMPRADLARLAEIVRADEHINSRYAVIDAQSCPTYPLATSRFMLKNTEFRDSALATMDFPSGIFLDLFPLDNLADDERAFRRQLWRSWLYNKFAIVQLTANPYIAGSGARASVLRIGTKAARAVLTLPPLKGARFNDRALSWLTRYADMSTRRIGYPCDTSRFWDVYERDDLLPVRWTTFEDTQVPIANRAEKLLEALYGDFMTPPPSNMRREHYPDILDFGPYASI